MQRTTPLSILLVILGCSMAQAGFLGSQLAYSTGFPHPAPFAGPYGAPFSSPHAAPLPVAPLSAHNPYAAVGYSTQPIVKIRSGGGGYSFGPFATYASVRSHHKFAFPAPVPSFYNAAPSVSYGTPAVAYSGFQEPNIVVKFGPPITTTTTTYTTTATAPVAHVGVPNPLNGVAGW